MKKQKNITALTLWANRGLGATLAGLSIFLVPIVEWYCTVRTLTGEERNAIIIAFYACAVVAAWALWNVDRLLVSILGGRVFVKETVGRLRRVQLCCALVSLICIPAACFYIPLVLMVVIMAFLCLAVGVLACVMDAAVAIREENDLTI